MGIQTREFAGFSAGTLKKVALVCMLIDHMAFLVAPQAYTPLHFIMHFIGRTAAPIFFFFLAEGYHYTKDKNCYTLRLAVFALVSYVPFLWFEEVNGLNSTGYLDMSVIYTLFVSFLALRARHELKNFWLKSGVILLCVLAAFIGDWGSKAVLAVLLFDYFRQNRLMQQLGFLLLIFVGDITPTLKKLFFYARTPQEIFTECYWIGIWCGVLVPMYLIGQYNGTRGKQNRWLFYVFYPVHLLILAMLISLFGGII